MTIPLGDAAGYGVGRIARMAPGGRVLVGYFFAQRFPYLPALDGVRELKPSEAALVRQFGDLELMRGRWTVLGGAEEWNRTEWPMPVFAQVDPLRPGGWRVEYLDDNPNGLPRRTRIGPESIGSYPPDGLLGAKAAEILLTRTIQRTEEQSNG